MEPSIYPTYKLSPSPVSDKISNKIYVITKNQADCIPQLYRVKFQNKKKVTIHDGLNQTHYVSIQNSSTFPITTETFVTFSKGVCELQDYHGYASDLLTNAYKFSRKEKSKTDICVHCHQETKDFDLILKLVEAKNRSKQLANSRGDYDGVPSYFQKIQKQFASKNNIQITVFKGDQLLKEGFRLMHAVGRASKNQPIFINLKYNGNLDSDQWVAFIGKGVCFDSGGLNLKSSNFLSYLAATIKDMYLDKHGAVSVLSAFQAIVEQKVKINLTCSVGFVENFVDANSYRPSDIIKSRKGIMVQISNTDAQGRLVLADCMNWTQQNYKVVVMIQLSTLTGAVIIALGHRFAGMFGNNDCLKQDLKKAGKQSHEQVWEMPLVDYHRELIKHKFGDITNSSGSTQAHSSQAAAFLENFVEKNVKWIHLDVAGTCMVKNQGTGFGSRLLIQYVRNYTKK